MSLAKYRSIRWQLPLSYAGIALIAAGVLGVILLTVLQNFYAEAERDNLRRNAQTISRLMAHAELPVTADTSHIQLAPLASVFDLRIELLDSDEAVVFDSGLVENFVIQFAPPEEIDPSPGFRVLLPAFPVLRPAYRNNIFVAGREAAMGEDDEYPIQLRAFPQTATALEANVLPVSRSLFGFTASEPSLELAGRPRSAQEITERISTRDGQTLGYIRLSNGPAAGYEIMQTVAQSWLIAGGFAVMLAAGIGWLMSKRISTPLSHLTEATRRIALGDLSIRTNVKRCDELGTLSETFNMMAGRIETTVNTLRNFASDAAHELHTPLTALRTNLELCAESPDAVTIQRALGQVERLQTLADDLLDLSRIEADPHALSVEMVGMNALIRQIGEVYASRAEQAGIDLSLSLPDTPIFAQGDRQQLNRALCNLLDNAVKFTQPGGHINLALSTSDNDLMLTIEDTGIGIPANEVATLFNRFRRGRNATGYPGSGLGLAIVKAIITRHHGVVTIQSQDTGTCVQVRLPQDDLPG